MSPNHRVNVFSVLYELGDYIQSELFSYIKANNGELLVSTALHYGVDIDESAHIFYPDAKTWNTKDFEGKIYGISDELDKLNPLCI